MGFGSLINSVADLGGFGPGSALKKGNKKAARAAAAANAQAQKITDQQYEKQQNYLNPYAQQGGAAFNRMGDLLGLSGNTGAEGYGSYGPGSHFTMSDLEQDPGYQFRLEQGQRALDNSVAARGMNLSGAQLKGAAKYNSGMASQEYGNAYQRYMDRYNTLGGMADIGYKANNRLADFAGTYGSNKANLFTGGGQDQANAALQKGKINSDIAGGWGAAIDEGINMANGQGWFSKPASAVNSQMNTYDSSTSFGQPYYNFG